MRLNSILKTAVIITMLLSCFISYSQTPFISQLEGLNEGKEARITIADGVIGQDYTIQYRLKNTSNWTDSQVKIKRNTDVSEGTVTGLEINKNYCFRIIQRDSVTKAEILSNEVCSITLKSTLLSENSVRLEWDKINSNNFSRVSLTVMEENGSNMNNIYPDKVSDTTFIYNQLICSVKFKFNLVATFSSITNGLRKNTIIKSSQILVDPKSVKFTSVLSSLGIVSVDKGHLNYNVYTPSLVSKFEFYRSTNDGEMIKVGENPNNVYQDRNVSLGENYYCYAHKGVNACGNESELSAKSCNIKLSSKTYGRLTWTPFTVHADGILYEKGYAEYTIQLIDAAGSVMSTTGITKDTTVAINVEALSLSLSNSKFRILAKIQGKINFQSQIIDFPIFSFSNPSPLYLILGNESSKTNLTVFPNPAEEKILINSSGAPVRYIELIDTKGRLIHKGEISGDTFNLSEFEKDKYILRLYDSNKKLLSTKTLMKL